MLSTGRLIAVVAAPAIMGGGLPALAQAPVLTVQARADQRELLYGARLSLTGTVTGPGGPVGGQAVVAQASPYPYRGFVAVALTRTASDGSFRFSRLRPGRNTRYRVLAHGAGEASPVLAVIVDPTHRLSSHSLGPGDDRLAVALHHTRELHSPPVTAYWYVARSGGRRFHLVARTTTRERNGRTYASADIDPPAKRFVFRVCVNPRWGRAMGPAASHRPCHRHDYEVAHPVR